MSVHIGVFVNISIHVCINVRISNISVNWTVVNNPVIFGRDFIVRCHVNHTECNDSGTKPNIRQWTGGKNYKLLCSKEGSTVGCTDSKYKMMTRNTGLDFDLLIRNFSESDLGYNYTCLCQFAVYTDTLSVERNNLICEYMSDIELSYMCIISVFFNFCSVCFCF